MPTFAEQWRARTAAVPYVDSVADGRMGRETFLETQLQFFHAVAAYPGSLSQLAARLPDEAARAVLEENVRDEAGRGHDEDAHVRTFRSLLERLGASADQLASSQPGLPTREFNEAVRAACADAPPEEGLAVVAAIEDLFTGVSRGLGNAIASRGWLTRERVAHYSVHETLDRAHADALFAVLEGWKGRGPDFVSCVDRGLRHGGELLLGYYDALLRHGDTRVP